MLVIDILLLVIDILLLVTAPLQTLDFIVEIVQPLLVEKLLPADHEYTFLNFICKPLTMALCAAQVLLCLQLLVGLPIFRGFRIEAC